MIRNLINKLFGKKTPLVAVDRAAEMRKRQQAAIPRAVPRPSLPASQSGLTRKQDDDHYTTTFHVIGQPDPVIRQSFVDDDSVRRASQCSSNYTGSSYDSGSSYSSSDSSSSSDSGSCSSSFD